MTQVTLAARGDSPWSMSSQWHRIVGNLAEQALVQSPTTTASKGTLFKHVLYLPWDDVGNSTNNKMCDGSSIGYIKWLL